MDSAGPEVANRLLDLPADIRILIYHYVLTSGPFYVGKPTSPKSRTWTLRRRYSPSPTPPLVPCVRDFTNVDLIHTSSQRLRHEILYEAYDRSISHVYYNESLFRTDPSYEQCVAEADAFAISISITDRVRNLRLGLSHSDAANSEINVIPKLLEFVALFTSLARLAVLLSLRSMDDPLPVTPNTPMKAEQLKYKLENLTRPENIILEYTDGTGRCTTSLLKGALW